MNTGRQQNHKQKHDLWSEVKKVTSKDAFSCLFSFELKPVVIKLWDGSSKSKTPKIKARGS